MLGTGWNPWEAHAADSYIAKHVRRSNRNLLLANATLLLSIAVVAGLNWRYLYNFFKGPFPIEKSQLVLASPSDQSPKYFFSINGDQSFESGITEVEQQTDSATNKVESESTTAQYVVLRVNDKLLVVKAPVGKVSTHYEGALTELPGDLRTQLVVPIENEYPKTKGMFLAAMFDATSFRESGYSILGMILPLMALAIYFLWVARKRRSNPERHPIVKRLAGFGDVHQVAQAIDSDWQMGATKLGKISVTPGWIFLPTPFGLKFCKIESLVWVYKKVTRHYHSFIPTGKTYAVVLRERSGRPIEVNGAQKNIDQTLQLIVTRAPWVVAGFDNNLAQLAKSNWPGFVSSVDQRRANTSQMHRAAVPTGQA